MERGSVFETKDKIKGYKVLECKHFLSRKIYRALAEITVPENSKVVFPFNDYISKSDLRTNRLIMDRIHKKTRFDKCHSWYVNSHEYNEGTEYTEPNLNTDTTRRGERGLHFAINKKDLIDTWTSAIYKVHQLDN